MAQLISLALETHPRIGPCFVVRFSWNSRVENPVEQIRRLVDDEREYEPARRRWWIAVRHVTLLADLFDNWPEEVALLAARQRKPFATAMTGVLRARMLAAVADVLDTVPTISWEDLLRAVGESAGWWLEEWRQDFPETAAETLGPACLGRVRDAAAEARTAFATWPTRAAFVHELLSPEAPSDAPDE